MTGTATVSLGEGEIKEKAVGAIRVEIIRQLTSLVSDWGPMIYETYSKTGDLNIGCSVKLKGSGNVIGVKTNLSFVPSSKISDGRENEISVAQEDLFKEESI